MATRRNWLKSHKAVASGFKKSMEDRIIFCANCETNRTLSVSGSGVLICSTCGSENWVHLPVTANVKESVFSKGELIAIADLTIEGQVEGKIEVKEHNVWIGPHGKVNAEIHAKNVIVAGDLVGDIYASEMVEIKSSGSMQGSIRCLRISIVDGAKFQGSVETEGSMDTPVRFGSRKVASAKAG